MTYKILWFGSGEEFKLLKDNKGFQITSITAAKLPPLHIQTSNTEEDPHIYYGVGKEIETRQRLFDWLRMNWQGDLIHCTQSQFHFLSAYLANYLNIPSTLRHFQSQDPQTLWAYNQADALFNQPLEAKTKESYTQVLNRLKKNRNNSKRLTSDP